MRYLNYLEEYFIVIAIVAAEIFVFINVFMRYLFNYSLDWPLEIGEFLLVAVTFIGCSVAVRRNAHIRIEILTQIFPKIKNKMDLVGDIIFIIFGIVLLCLGIEYAIKLYKFKIIKVAVASDIPMYIPYMVVPISGALLIIRISQRIYNIVRRV